MRPLSFEVLATRALNSTRLLYPPAYVGLRLLLSQVARRRFQTFGHNLIARKLDAKAQWRYHCFPVLKSRPDTGSPTYRQMLVGSPITTLAEAHVLSFLAREPAFETHPCAYSYLWPHSRKTGRSHAYFWDGYSCRNLHVRRLLETDPRQSAVVVDIKRFYPSVDRASLRVRFSSRLRKLKQSAPTPFLERFVSDLLGQEGTGIPIGPDLGHVLGHVALEDVDRQLADRFGDHYLRYVDDIIVVAEHGTEARVINAIEEVLGSEGYELNVDKTDVVPSDVWLSNVPSSSRANRISLEMLIWATMLRIARHPNRANTLRNAFTDAGFGLPFDRIRSMAKYGRLRSFIRSLAIRPRRAPAWLVWAWWRSESDLMEIAARLKATLLEKAQQISQQEIPPQATIRRRWYVQECRYVFNRLLYMFNTESYREILRLLPRIEELAEIRLVLLAFIDNNVNDLVEHPGRAVAAFSQLWMESKRPAPSFDAHFGASEKAFEAVLTLVLYGVIPYREQVFSDGPKRGELLAFAGGAKPEGRTLLDLSFEDELRSLQLSESLPTAPEILTSRFSVGEAVSLEGLQLVGDDYTSGA